MMTGPLSHLQAAAHSPPFSFLLFFAFAFAFALFAFASDVIGT